MLPVALALLAAFVLLFLIRLGGSERRALLARWPAVLLAGAALFLLARGQIWPALALGLLAAAAWRLWPALNTRPQTRRPPVADAADLEAGALLGVSLDASEDEIRAFCRERLAPYKVPARVAFRKDLPKTMVGKVLRRLLVEEARAS